MNKQKKKEGGFWRVGSPSIMKDVETWKEAKETLGKHLQSYPTDYHWMAYGDLDECSDFVADESTFVEID